MAARHRECTRNGEGGAPWEALACALAGERGVERRWLTLRSLRAGGEAGRAFFGNPGCGSFGTGKEKGVR